MSDKYKSFNLFIFYHKLGLCKEYLFLIATINASSSFSLNHGKIAVVNTQRSVSNGERWSKTD